MNFFSRKNLLGETQTVTCRIERDPTSGSFGLSLNDHNRITKVAKGSPSEKAKLIVFDRIIKVDGAPLDGPIKKFAEGKQALLLTVERPPKEMYRAIVDQENAEGSQAYSAPKPPPGPPPSAMPWPAHRRGCWPGCWRAWARRWLALACGPARS